MKIAIPLAEGKLTIHFGHCAEFALIDVDEKGKSILSTQTLPAPPHQPGLLPPWLAERGVNLIIAGGMGQRAMTLLAEHGIKVIVGAQPEVPEKLVNDWLNGALAQGTNCCDH